jgi:hypothetical protein
MSSESVKISANIPKGTYDQLQWIASQRGTTMTEVLRRAVEHEAYILNQTAQGSKILERSPQGTISELLIR